MKLGSAATATALTLFSGSAAQAAEVISLPLSQVLNSGQSATGTFNLSSFLNPGNGKQYLVKSANLAVQGYSPYGQTGTAFAGYYFAQPYTYYYSYSCGSWWSSRTCYGSNTYYTQVPAYTSQDAFQDALSVFSGDATGMGMVGSDGSYAGNYYGQMVANLVLGALELEQLNSTGIFAFSALASTNSSINVGTASLTFSLEEAVSAVPEPTTWSMLIMGFGAIGANMRRKKNTKKRRVALA